MKTRDEISKLVVLAIADYQNKLTDVIDELFKMQSSISPYHLSHNELSGDCCGLFNVIDESGFIVCNECGKKERDIVLDGMKKLKEGIDYLHKLNEKTNDNK